MGKTVVDSLDDCLECYYQHLLNKFGEKFAHKKLQKLKTVIFQVFYPLIGQPNYSRLQNHQLLKLIPFAGFIEAYDEKIIAEIEHRQKQNDKSAAIHASCWKAFISWLSDQCDYQPSSVPLPIRTSEISYRIKAQKKQGLTSNSSKKVSDRPRLVYQIQPTDLPPHLQTLLKELKEFCRVLTPQAENENYRKKSQKQKKQGLRESSFAIYQTYFLRYLGWLSYLYQQTQTKLSLKLEDITTKDLYNQSLLESYIEWQLKERQNSYAHIYLICHLSIKIAQYDLQQDSGKRQSEAHPLIRGLMELRSQYSPQNGERPYTSVSALEQRLLDHQECEEIVRFLGKRAKYLEQQAKERQHCRLEVVEDAWQDYLIIALLTYGAMRQREIKEMKLEGQRLYFNQKQKCYWCCLFPADHKTHGERAYPLFPGPMQELLTVDFTYYLEKIRPQNLEHAYVFFNRGNSQDRFARRGQPITGKLTEIVKRSVYFASRELFGPEKAKAMTPHDFRRSLATWFAHYGHLDDAVIFAQLHGHSVDMLLKLYAQVRSQEQTKGATIAFKRTAMREQILSLPSSEQDNRRWMKQFSEGIDGETLARCRAILEHLVM